MLKLVQTLRLQQKLAPQMIQSLQLLQMPTLELEQLIKQELETNPVLEAEDGTDTADSEEQWEDDRNLDSEDEVTFDEDYWANYFNQDYDITHGVREEVDPNEEEREFNLKQSTTIWEDLTQQLHLLDLTEKDREIGEFIIGCLDENGCLQNIVTETVSSEDTSPEETEQALKEKITEEIAMAMGASPDDMERMIGVIQSLDPPGVGARSIKECLLIQLREKGLECSIAYRILSEQFDNFKNRRFREITRALKISDDEMRENIEIISSLNPKPGSSYPLNENTHIIPDIIVKKIDSRDVHPDFIGHILENHGFQVLYTVIEKITLFSDYGFHDADDGISSLFNRVDKPSGGV